MKDNFHVERARILKNAITLLVALLLSHGHSAIAGEKEPPAGWRYPTEADYLGDWKTFRNDIPEPFHVGADFNGDSIADDAWILVRTSGKGWGLFVFLSEPNGSRKMIQLEDNPNDQYPQRMGIKVARPGRHETACGKGYFECEKDEPGTLELKDPGINYFMYESANSFFYWNKKSKSFKRIWMSD